MENVKCSGEANDVDRSLDVSASNWFAEVKELREKAEEYR